MVFACGSEHYRSFLSASRVACRVGRCAIYRRHALALGGLFVLQNDVGRSARMSKLRYSGAQPSWWCTSELGGSRIGRRRP